MSKELILILASVLFLFVAIFTINKISKLNVSKSYKTALIYITIIIPIVGYFLAMRAGRKSNI
jgi:hypothetical protein